MSVAQAATGKLEQRATALASRAKELKVNNQNTYDRAVEHLLTIAALRREIEQHHAPLKKSTYAAWQQAIAAEKKLLEPVVEAERLYKTAIAGYEAEQRRIEAEARAKAEAEALRQAEDARERELEEAESQGADAAEIEAMITAPLVVTRPKVEPVFQQAKGVSVASNWKGEVVSLGALVKAVAAGQASLNLLMANESAINQLARATRGTLQVPGIRFFSQATVRAGKR
jgi:hypothetical protein